MVTGPSDAVAGSDGDGLSCDDGATSSSTDLEVVAPTTLVEITPGVAVVFGEVPDGLELIGFDLIPSFDREQLSSALGSIGNVGTIAGNLAEAYAGAQGLYRISEATASLLGSGAQMAIKDGANIGAIFQNGELIAQARFIPASMTAATTIAAIGPAVAMIALQMKLGEISGLVRTNIALTTQTLKAIRNEQWSELEGISEAVDAAIQEVRALDAITDSVWEPVASTGPAIRAQMKLYRRNVAGHVQELGRLEGRPRREYLENNAEAILFDTHALLRSLKVYAEYQGLRAALARARSTDDASEARLFERITSSTVPEIESSLADISHLTGSLVRELRIVAELPGRVTVPLTKKRRDARTSRVTSAQLLDAITPLADRLQPPVPMPQAPDVVCAPEGLDLDPYFRVLRWFLNDDEDLRALAFPYEIGTHDLTGLIPAILAKRVDATWDALTPGKARAAVEAFATSSFVAVTNHRIITATPRAFLRRGELRSTYALDEVRYVRPRTNHSHTVRGAITVATERSDVHWLFPAEATSETIDAVAGTIDRAARASTAGHNLIDRPSAEEPAG